MIENILLITLFWAVFFMITYASYYVVEKLVKPFNYFDRIPTNCLKCCTTWSLLASYISISIIISNWWFLGFGIIITVMEAIALHLTEEEKGLIKKTKFF